MSAVEKSSAYPDTVQSGLPRLGKTPKGWTRTTLSQHLYEERRPVNLQDEATYDLVTVKRARGGVVKRETKRGADISVKTQFEVKSGDFLISKRQIVHGACGLVPDELDGATVSNEYSVLRSRGTLDLEYLKYLSHSVYFQQTCFHSSIGVHIEKMIFKLDKWFEREFDLPPLSEQRRIVQLLSAWDKGIVVAQRLLDNSLSQKAALVETLIGRPKGRKRSRKDYLFQEIAQKGNRMFDPRTADTHRRCIELEHVESGTGRLLSEASTADLDSTKVLFSPTSVLFGKLRPYLKKYVFPKFEGACSSEFWVLNANTKVCAPEYLFYLIQTEAFQRAAGVSAGSKMPRADWEYVSDQTFALPPLTVQKGIVDQLRAADRLVAAYQRKLDQLRIERAALLQQVLNGKRRLSSAQEAA